MTLVEGHKLALGLARHHGHCHCVLDLVLDDVLVQVFIDAAGVVVVRENRYFGREHQVLLGAGGRNYGRGCWRGGGLGRG